MRASLVIFVTVAATWLAAIILGSLVSLRAVEKLLEPWFAICRFVTPDAWQTQGNALLGLLWIATGITAYGAVAAIVPISIIRVMRKETLHSQNKVGNVGVPLGD